MHQCRQCNNIFGNNKIKCDVCKIHLRDWTLPQEAISTEIVAEKKNETVKFINYTNNFSDDRSVTLVSETDSIHSNTASL